MYLVKDQLIFKNSKKEYFKYNLASKSITKIKIEEYCEILFGQYNYRLRNILELSISITNDKIFGSHYQKDHLVIYNLEGELLEIKSKLFQDLTPYSISVNKPRNELWVASGGFQIVKCIDLTTEITKLTIGTFHEETKEMSFPEDVFIFNNNVYITEMGHKRVSKVNLDTFDKCTYLKTNEPIWQFVKNQFGEFVLLDSGIHRIINNKFVNLKTKI